MIWSLIVGALIGLIAGAITKKGSSMGWISNILAGLVGSFVGQALTWNLGTFACWHGVNTIHCWCSDCGCCCIFRPI